MFKSRWEQGVSGHWDSRQERGKDRKFCVQGGCNAMGRGPPPQSDRVQGNSIAEAEQGEMLD